MTFYMQCLIPVLLVMFSLNTFSAQENETKTLTEHQQWLKNKFSKQHDQLMPIVAVADILFECNRANDNAYGKYSLNTLITKMPKERLAEKVSSCLSGESINSDIAINYGLLGCFGDQFSTLTPSARDEKIEQVKQAIASLPLAERKKSFTQCVTDQSITYLH